MHKFRYLGDTLSVDGDGDAVAEARIQTGWNTSRQLVTLLTNNGYIINNDMETGPVKSMVDYIIVWQEDKSKVCNVKVIPNEEVPKHKLLVMDMQINTTKRPR